MNADEGAVGGMAVMGRTASAMEGVAGGAVAILWEKMQRGIVHGRFSSRAGHGTSLKRVSGLNIPASLRMTEKRMVMDVDGASTDGRVGSKMEELKLVARGCLELAWIVVSRTEVKFRANPCWARLADANSHVENPCPEILQFT